jgi:hypothetical protein
MCPAVRASLVVVCCLTLAACGRQNPVSPSEVDRVPVPLAPAAGPVTVMSGPPEVFVGAGDIASCGDGNAEATGRLLDGIGGTVFALGDNAYPDGTAADYRNCYDPAWGRHRNRTRPVPGNHEYHTAGAAPYFDYFSGAAGPYGIGYYSFDLSAWHVVALNSNISADRGSAQAAWLRQDLAAHPSACTLAYWHHPLFSSGGYGDSVQMRELWRILYAAGAEVVLNGHEHLYERFAAQDPDGGPDPARGIRQFTVGTGGTPLRERATFRSNSEALISAHGVLKLALSGGGYDWEFIPVSGPGDWGSGTCH